MNLPEFCQSLKAAVQVPHKEEMKAKANDVPGNQSQDGIQPIKDHSGEKSPTMTLGSEESAQSKDAANE